MANTPALPTLSRLRNNVSALLLGFSLTVITSPHPVTVEAKALLVEHTLPNSVQSLPVAPLLPTTELVFAPYTFKYYSPNNFASQSRDGNAFCEIFENGELVYRSNLPSGELRVLHIKESNNLTSSKPVKLAKNGPACLVLEFRGPNNSWHYVILSFKGHPKNVANFDWSDGQLDLEKAEPHNYYNLASMDRFDAWGHQPVCATLAYHLENLDDGNRAPKLRLVRRHVCPSAIFKLASDERYQIIPAGPDRNEDAPITFASAELSEQLTDLIYAGHMKDAKKLLKKVWPDNIKGKKLYFQALLAELATSPNWPAVQQLNR